MIADVRVCLRAFPISIKLRSRARHKKDCNGSQPASPATLQAKHASRGHPKNINTNI